MNLLELVVFFLKKTSTTPVKQHDFSYPDLMGTQESNKRFSPWLWQATRGPQPWNGDQLPLVMTMIFLCRNHSDRSIYPLSVCLCVCQSIYLYIYLSFFLSFFLSVYRSVWLSVLVVCITHTHIYLPMLWFSCRVGGWVSWPWPTKADRRRVSKSSPVCNCNNFSVQLSFLTPAGCTFMNHWSVTCTEFVRDRSRRDSRDGRDSRDSRDSRHSRGGDSRDNAAYGYGDHRGCRSHGCACSVIRDGGRRRRPPDVPQAA